LDTNPQIFFHLQQQRLIELIRSGIQYSPLSQCTKDHHSFNFNSFIFTRYQLKSIVDTFDCCLILSVGSIADALEFAQEELAPRGEENVRNSNYEYLLDNLPAVQLSSFLFPFDLVLISQNLNFFLFHIRIS
jgi:hypothetical protein